MTREEAKRLNPVTLAFMGDGVYEVFVREKITLEGSKSAARLHHAAVEMVRASFQSKAVEMIFPLLSEEEAEIYKRGRNSTSSSVPKSSNPRDYRRATGLEALFGYLHLIGEGSRLKELFEVIYHGYKAQKSECP